MAKIKRDRVDWQGYLPAITTPFAVDGTLDEAGLGRLLEWLHGEGMHGLVLAGTTGEWTSMTASERARLFEATSAAEQIHIGLEAGVISEIEPGYERPAAPEAEGIATDLNLIAGALGEIYETSDMYPSFIKVAQEEGNKKAEFVFTRAKLAEAVHAELYMDAYNNIDAATDEAYYLCPICGYIHKGDDFEKCPICFTPADKFRKF